MKHLILAGAAILGGATLVSAAGARSALADRPLSQVTATRSFALPPLRTDVPSQAYVRNGLPEQNTARHGTQLAVGNHPTAETDAHATQLAAAGGAHPQSETNVRATQLAASGMEYVRHSHGDYA